MAHIPYINPDAAAEHLKGTNPAEAMATYDNLHLDVVFAVDKTLLDMNSWAALSKGHFGSWTAQTRTNSPAANAPGEGKQENRD